MKRAARGAKEDNVTKLDKPLRREIEIDSRPYTLVLGPHELKLTPKGRRRGIEVPWPALLAISERGHATSSAAPLA